MSTKSSNKIEHFLHPLVYAILFVSIIFMIPGGFTNNVFLLNLGLFICCISVSIAFFFSYEFFGFYGTSKSENESHLKWSKKFHRVSGSIFFITGIAMLIFLSTEPVFGSGCIMVGTSIFIGTLRKIK